MSNVARASRPCDARAVSRVSRTCALLLLVLAGCTAHSSEPTPAEPTPAEPMPAADAEQVCSVHIVRLGPPAPTYDGKGEGESTEAALELARRDACTRAPKDQRAACGDPNRFVPRQRSSSSSFSYKDGKSTTSHTATLTLVDASAEVTAERRSERGMDDACERARLAACVKAGAEGRCFADGTYRVESERRGPFEPSLQSRQSLKITAH